MHRWKNTHMYWVCILSISPGKPPTQEEIIKGADSESFGEEVAAAKRTQENLNKSMKLNDGQSKPVQPLTLLHVFLLLCVSLLLGTVSKKVPCKYSLCIWYAQLKFISRIVYMCKLDC